MKNEPAYPIWTPDMPVEGGGGLSKLEYFAGQADIPWDSVLETMELNNLEKANGDTWSLEQTVAQRAIMKFVEAEAMIKEAEKRK